MSQVARNLSQSIAIQIEQGVNAASMSGTAMGPTEPTVVALNTTNSDLNAKQAALLEAVQTTREARSSLRAAAKAQRVAFGNLGTRVQLQSDGDETYILSCGFGVRSSGTPNPPVVDPPTALKTKVNGSSGKVYFSWTAPTGAQFFEVQSTTDPTGAAGWTTAPEMPSASKTTIENLTSGTRYSLRVRAWGNGQPGPWSTPVQQMVL